MEPEISGRAKRWMSDGAGPGFASMADQKEIWEFLVAMRVLPKHRKAYQRPPNTLTARNTTTAPTTAAATVNPHRELLYLNIQIC
jgi:hypothetical protein